MKCEIERKEKESEVWVNVFMKVEGDLRLSPYLCRLWKKKIAEVLGKDVEEVQIVETDTSYEVSIRIDENFSVRDINAICQIVEALTELFLQYNTNLLKFVKEILEMR